MKWLRYGALTLVLLIVLAAVVLLVWGMAPDARRLTAAVDVARSPQDTWQWLTEPEKLKSWVSWLVEIRVLTPPPHGVGSKTVWVMEDHNNNNQKMEMIEELTEYDPPRKLNVRVSAPMGFHGEVSFALTDLGNGHTRVVQASSFQFEHWLAKLFTPLIMRSAQTKAVEDMQRLKSKMEASR